MYKRQAVELLVIESALIAGFSKILAEKLIRLCGADTEDVLAAEDVYKRQPLCCLWLRAPALSPRVSTAPTASSTWTS